MAISGYKTKAVFDRYHIVSESDLRTAIGRLSGYIAEEEKRGVGAENGDAGALAKNPHTIRIPELKRTIQ